MFLHSRPKQHCRGGHWPSVREYSQRCEKERECSKDFSNINNRAGAKATCSVLYTNRPCAEHADERCSPLQNCGLLQSLIQTAEIYRLPPQYIIGPAQKRRFTFLIRIASAAAADERCSPLRLRGFLNNAAVGAAIGRPTGGCR